MSDSGQLPDYSASKLAWRERLHSARQARSTQDRATAATAIHATLTRLVTDLTTIAGYVPFGSEPGGPALPSVLAAALAPGGRLLLPVLLPDRSLDWALHQGALCHSQRGPTEPAGPRLGPTTINAARLIVVPALAVDRRGVRLGRGGGSYDRALALVDAGAPVVALLYDDELVDRLPAEPHDQRVSAVITPKRGLVWLPKTGSDP